MGPISENIYHICFICSVCVFFSFFFSSSSFFPFLPLPIFQVQYLQRIFCLFFVNCLTFSPSVNSSSLSFLLFYLLLPFCSYSPNISSPTAISFKSIYQYPLPRVRCSPEAPVPLLTHSPMSPSSPHQARARAATASGAAAAAASALRRPGAATSCSTAGTRRTRWTAVSGSASFVLLYFTSRNRKRV